jgi:ABC-type polysaccharide/polyol phosphate transport system ATPase subunit
MAMTALKVENVTVDFPIYSSSRSLRKTLFERATGGVIERGEGRHQDRLIVKALNDISFELQEGDRLGLVGHNGAGKSTLLKVLAGVYEPVSGQVLVNGKITPLFDMLPGLDADDSGYENIATCGMLWGLSRAEIERLLPDIEEFSELGEYLSLPVRTYSAGMSARLGFALATAMDPGILIMDEGIGAGDARFADRAARRLAAFVGRSRVLVLASHSNELIRSMCNKAALMQAGRIVSIGPVEQVLKEYDVASRAAHAPG